MADSNTLFGFGVFAIVIIVIISIVLIYLLYMNVPFVRHLLYPIFHAIGHFFGQFTRNNERLAISDVCSIIPGTYESASRVPSFYLAHIAFFASFIITNAAIVYNLPEDSKLPKALYDNRRTRTAMIIGIITVLYIGIVLYRYNTQCESYLGIFLTTTVFSSLGFGWYKFAELCGAKNADIFGITSAIVESTAKPLVCGANAP